MHLRELLSNLTPTLHRVLDEVPNQGTAWLAAVSRSRTVPQESATRLDIRQAQHRLSPAETGALVSAYQAGRSVAALSRDFKIHKSTVQAHLVRAGVVLRPQKVLTADQATEAIELYLAGATLKQLGPKFGVGHNTIRNYLLRAGVELRAAKRQTRVRPSGAQVLRWY